MAIKIDSINERRLKIRDILMNSNAVSTTRFVEKINPSIGSVQSYYIPNPDSQVTISYNVLANNLVKHGYGNIKDFSEEVINMLNMFCDDDDQITIKKRELEVNMFSILEEFIPVSKED